MQWTRGAALDRWARLGLAARVLKALSNASVFLLLLLPLVVLSNCGGTVAEFTGYQVLQETAVPTGYTQPLITLTYGPDWWVVAVMVFAAAGLGSAWRGGIPRSVIGGAAAIGGPVSPPAAVDFLAPRNDTPYWSPVRGVGRAANLLALAFGPRLD